MHGHVRARDDRGRDEERRRGRDVARNLHRRPGASASAPSTVDARRPPRRPARRRARASAPCDPGSAPARRPSSRPSAMERPRAGSPTSPAPTRPEARSRSPAAARPRPTSGAWPSVVSTRRAHPAERLGDALHRPRRERRVADELEAARLAGEHARRAGASASRRCRSRSRPRASQAPQADAVHAQRVDVLLDRPRRRARGPRRSSPLCRPSGRSPRSRVSPSQIAPISTARCEIDLSPGTATCPSRAGTGSMRIARESRVGPDAAQRVQGQSRDADLLRHPADGREAPRQLRGRVPPVRRDAGAGRGVLLHRRPALDQRRRTTRRSCASGRSTFSRCSSRPASIPSARRSSRRATSPRTPRRIGCCRP